MTIKHIFLAGLLALSGLSAGPVRAEEMSPVGQWRLSAGKSHYEITYCGDGRQLCAKVIWLGGGDLTEKTRPYLNTYIVQDARPAGKLRWKGTLNLFGEKVAGTVRQIDANTLSLTGCKFVILCKSYQMFRL